MDNKVLKVASGLTDGWLKVTTREVLVPRLSLLLVIIYYHAIACKLLINTDVHVLVSFIYAGKISQVLADGGYDV